MVSRWYQELILAIEFQVFLMRFFVRISFFVTPTTPTGALAAS